MQHKLKRWAAPAVGILATATLAGCTFGPQQPTTTQQIQTENGTANVTTSGNDVSITGEANNTSFSFGQGLPDNWPSDLPTPSGATVAFAASEDDADENTRTYSASFSLDANANGATIINQLKGAFEAAGWDVSEETQGSFGITVAGFEAEKGQQTASVAFIGISGTSNGQTETSQTATISAEYPL